MTKAQNKFILTAVLTVFTALFLLLGTINMTNFTMASEDADRVTGKLERANGFFAQMESTQQEQTPQAQTPQGQLSQGQNPMGQDQIDQGRQNFRGGFGPMGPDSPDMAASSRYFTVSFTSDGESQIVAYAINAVSQEDALSWASDLYSGEDLDHVVTGWTRGTYRYRIYQQDGQTYVTVLDQGRELISCYRILAISGIGLMLGTLISFVILKLTAQKLFSPVEEADRKQKQFLLQAEKEFKVPLTVISADTELIERRNGPTDQTRSIHRQVKQMGALVKDLGRMAVFSSEQDLPELSLSAMTMDALNHKAERFAAKGLDISTEIAPDIKVKADAAMMGRVLDELTDNMIKYAKTHVRLILKKEGERILLQTENDSDLPAGDADQVFDRFTTLKNASPEEAGLGLSYVKDAVKSMDGRVSARVLEGGTFLLQIGL